MLLLPGRRDLLALMAYRPMRYPFLLASANTWRLFAFPERPLVLEPPASEEKILDFGRAMDDLFLSLRRPSPLAFAGGWTMYWGFEARPFALPAQAPASPLPLAALWRVPAVIGVEGEKTFLAAQNKDLLHEMEKDLACAPPLSLPAVAASSLAEEPPEHFMAGVLKILDFIREGEVYQVNLARRFEVFLQDAAPWEVFAALRLANPAPHMALWLFSPDTAIVSASPERLFCVHDGKICTRPIAGTSRRSSRPARDLAQARALLASAKDRAEHVMLVDLARNDLGKICIPGSIAVRDFFSLRTYATVHHLESEVEGKLRQDVTPSKIILSLFPGGTITGCPKIRATEIISSLEPWAREAYTGGVGWLSRSGNMDMNILIRTLIQTGKQLSFCAGAGIVADSRPEKELLETYAKAKGILHALGMGRSNGDSSC